jgi:hypothetical protein
MNAPGVILLLICCVAVFTLPRSSAPIALFAGMIYLTKGQGIEIGIFLQADRLLLLVALARTAIRGEWPDSPLNGIDKLVIVAAAWALVSSLFREQAPGSGLIYAVGNVFSTTTVYFVVRGWCRDINDLKVAVVGLALLLVPVAFFMGVEKYASRNYFSLFGGSPDVMTREGIIRARGPFRHAILAGTVGAACVPLMIGLFRQRPITGLIGLAASLGMVAACHSSGPIVSMLVGIGIVLAWRYRHFAKHAVWTGVAMYLAVEVISNRPAYFALVTRLDLTGSSTAYYRARLIKTSIDHFHEWWLIGTDYTAHWIPSGIGSIILGGKHLDITNVYIARGVDQGLIGLLLLVLMIIFVVRMCVRACNLPDVNDESRDAYLLWALGATVGSLGVSGLSVAFYDQSGTFIWLMMGWIASAAGISLVGTESEASVDHSPLNFDESPLKWVRGRGMG